MHPNGFFREKVPYFLLFNDKKMEEGGRVFRNCWDLLHQDKGGWKMCSRTVALRLDMWAYPLYDVEKVSFATCVSCARSFRLTIMTSFAQTLICQTQI